jgi:hypothetical protein
MRVISDAFVLSVNALHQTLSELRRAPIDPWQGSMPIAKEGPAGPEQYI